MASQTCPRQEQNKAACPCVKTSCENHGRCCLCVAAHRRSGKPVSCMAALPLEK